MRSLVFTNTVTLSLPIEFPVKYHGTWNIIWIFDSTNKLSYFKTNKKKKKLKIRNIA